MRIPNKDETALIQARHMYNEAVVEKIIDGGGYTQGSDDLIIRVNRMSWGLFESTILKAYKENQYLRDHNPELVENDEKCVECKGVGGFPYSGEENEKQIAEWNDGMDENDNFYVKAGSVISKFCSPCQGTGIVLKPSGPYETET